MTNATTTTSTRPNIHGTFDVYDYAEGDTVALRTDIHSERDRKSIEDDAAVREFGVLMYNQHEAWHVSPEGEWAELGDADLGAFDLWRDDDGRIVDVEE